MKIQLIHNRPILEIEDEMALNRNRDTDRTWGGLVKSSIVHYKVKEVELTSELKQTLLEDLAYTYGHDSKKFSEKLKEFNLL